MRVAPLFFGLLVVAVAQCVSAGTLQDTYSNLVKRQVDPSGASLLPKNTKDPKDSKDSKGPKGPKNSNKGRNSDESESGEEPEPISAFIEGSSSLMGPNDSGENKGHNNHPGFGGKNCASVSIPARVAIQFCGCNDPACPKCPCKADGEA